MEIPANEMIEQLKTYISEGKKVELEDLFAYGEKIKKEGEKLKQKFRESHGREDFLKLLPGMDKRMREHEKYLEKISGLERERFIKEYLYDKVIYSGSVDDNNKYEEEKLNYHKQMGLDQWIKEAKSQFQPGMWIFLYYNNIGDEGVATLAKEWKSYLQPGMTICLADNNIGAEGIETLAKEWKDTLQPGIEISLSKNKIGADGLASLVREWKDCLQLGMEIDVYGNNIGDEGVEILAKEWKNSLQPGMVIDLGSNNIGVEGVEKLAKEWKENLKPGMTINLEGNHIGAKGAEILMREWKESLKQGMTINLKDNGIFLYQTIKSLWDREKENKDKGIKCEILLR